MRKRYPLLGTSLLPVPSALVTYRSVTGLLQVAAATWVGTTCADSSMLAVGLKSGESPLEKLGPEGFFAVNLPASADCFSRLFMECSGWPESTFTLIEGGLSGVPLIAECPIHIECRRGRVKASFEREILRGEVMILHRDGTALNQPRPSELCRINPFAETEGYAKVSSGNAPFGISASVESSMC